MADADRRHRLISTWHRVEGLVLFVLTYKVVEYAGMTLVRATKIKDPPEGNDNGLLAEICDAMSLGVSAVVFTPGRVGKQSQLSTGCHLLSKASYHFLQHFY